MKRLLFITGNRLGDVVISTGLLRAFQNRYGDAQVTIVCGPVAASLFDCWPGVDRVIRLEKKRFDLHWLKLWRDCFPTRWDHIVDLRGSALSYLLNARARSISRGGRKAGLRLHHHGALLQCCPTPQPEVHTTEKHRRKARSLLPKGPAWIAIAPTANWCGKIWPAASFRALCERFIRDGYRIAVFYGPGPQEKARAEPFLAEPACHHVDVGGDRALPEVIALLQRCSAFIGNDSGLMHLAAAAGTPTIGLFGPSRASEYAPSGPCATYIQAEGPEGEAPIDGISVDKVFDVACDLLRRGQ
ncbi:glycosyltransferase family 9 protein [Candidatus Kirkpatrickella diaphorinae]|uniref:Glycosyltransferase family 9 protein n=1 Tax=Candidatus Kirkpatrickella diaphorinae TaxID=2984322 RepID=A0ABY6GL84_9PROT|nr:glycosyltransferase family 9 protein [Candidatus Kirkpatrickella diaphorinae]UYH52077.1 glycosyltransferase family 9 protein [Candidatus Kirkpatrickella diaphorinae]